MGRNPTKNRMKIAVINYGAGNLPNAVRALQHVGADIEVTDDPAVVRAYLGAPDAEC